MCLLRAKSMLGTAQRNEQAFKVRSTGGMGGTGRAQNSLKIRHFSFPVPWAICPIPARQSTGTKMPRKIREIRRLRRDPRTSRTLTTDPEAPHSKVSFYGARGSRPAEIP